MSAYLPIPWLVFVLGAAVVLGSAKAGFGYFADERTLGASLLSGVVILVLTASAGVGLVVAVNAGMELQLQLQKAEAP